jgi:hypothetical protein
MAFEAILEFFMITEIRSVSAKSLVEHMRNSLMLFVNRGKCSTGFGLKASVSIWKKIGSIMPNHGVKIWGGRGGR